MKVVLDDFAKAPTRAHSTDAGLDLYTPISFTIAPGKTAAIHTGVHVELPSGHFGKIESKSGLNVGFSIVCCGGVIDEGYTGAIVVKLYNFGRDHYTFNAGDKIAQLIIQPCKYVDVEVVSEFNTNTERGDNGFGSTGK